MNLRTFGIGVAALLLVQSPARALITEHGNQPVHLSSWAEPVDKLINHPARFQGRIGPLAPQAAFHYDGTPEVLNGILKEYAAIPGRSSVIYLTTGSMSGPLEVRSGLDGTIKIRIRIADETDLKRWKIPKGLGVERLDLPGAPLSSDRSALEAAIAKFLRQHPVPADAKDSRQSGSRKLRATTERFALPE